MEKYIPTQGLGVYEVNHKIRQIILSLFTLNNYFSLGIDAHIALDFHEKRETNPQKFTSRWFNMLSYIESWKGDIIKKSWKDLKDYIELVVSRISIYELVFLKMLLKFLFIL